MWELLLSGPGYENCHAVFMTSWQASAVSRHNCVMWARVKTDTRTWPSLIITTRGSRLCSHENPPSFPPPSHLSRWVRINSQHAITILWKDYKICRSIWFLLSCIFRLPSKLLIKLSYQIDKSSCWCFLLPHIPLKSEVRALIVIRVGAVPPGSIFGLSVKILIVVYCSVKTKLWQEIERDWQTRPSQMILSTCTQQLLVTFHIWLK